MNSGRKGTFYCNRLNDNHEINGNYHYSRQQIVPAICIKKPSEEPLTSVFSIVKIKMVSTILMLENYENHLEIFTSSNNEQIGSFPTCFNSHSSPSHVVQLDHLGKDLAIVRFLSPKSLQSNPSSVLCCCLLLVTVVTRTFFSEPLPPYLVLRTPFLFAKVTLVYSYCIWKIIWNFTTCNTELAL